MDIRILKPRKALNKAFLKVKPKRSEIEGFKSGLSQLLDRIEENESEEFHKNLVRDFLKQTYYEPNHFINTKGRNDLVIHHSTSASATVGVIIEAKKPSNRTEMVSKEKLNVKAFHELVLYYLRERISQKNIEIKYLIATNIYEWFIFDATLFDRLFAQNLNLVRQFHDFENGRLADTKTDFFYKQVAEPFIHEIRQEIEFTWFNIRDYEKALRNANKKDDNQLIALFKLLSPEHLLKLPFANDSNSLDKRFYSELLHLIGLTETKEGARKLIGRNREGERHSGSLIENAIIQLDMLDKISGLKNRDQYGSTHQERLFNVALELAITWINRILFLKLLEAQLVTWHRNDRSYEFLNHSGISDYDNLNTLFFQVLARKPQDRHEDVRTAFDRVPYLNSSLFEPSEIEKATIFVSNLRNDKALPIFPATVLKDRKGKKRTGTLAPLEYLFEFLNAYDFASEGSEEIQEENKTLINASVLGLIFEKINGYRDGSFFTPGFITMYMCRETIRKAVVQKFNEVKKWYCSGLDELYDKIEDRNEANRIINDLKICDPAVGSGHFLVSALNEIIAVKNDLKILQDRHGRRLKEYHVEVVNDELVVTDEEGKLFEYHPANRESQRIQETLFHEKQEIIENCLFGVDINPNSVKICQLRLWIELLKNAYYKIEDSSAPFSDSGQIRNPKSEIRNITSQSAARQEELETLPNIDINIKCGNSLVSRFALDADLKKALKGSRYDITGYRLAVQTYRNTRSKEVKREMEQHIERIKSDFCSEISQNDPKIKRLRNLNGELFSLSNQGQLFERTKKEKAEWSKKVEKLTTEIQKLETEIEEIKANKIFEHSFEWRFEFPEVLNDDGDYTGFDLVIGNPPYIRQEEIKEMKPYLKETYKLYSGTADLYLFFVDRAFMLIKQKAIFNFIMPNKWMQTSYGKPLRSFLLGKRLESIVDFGDLQVFEEATTYPCILIARNDHPANTFQSATVKTLNFDSGFETYLRLHIKNLKMSGLGTETWIISSDKTQKTLQRIKANSISLSEYVKGGSIRGLLTGLSEAFIISEEKKDQLISEDPASSEIIRPFLMGRDIRPYRVGKPGQWAILIPKGFTIKNRLNPGSIQVKEPMTRYGYLEEDEAWAWFSGNYPAVAKHLLPYKNRAEKRMDKGDFWWELRACDYYDQFQLPKIMYQVFQVKPCFIFDNIGMYCNNSMWFIPSSDKSLLGILNSKMGWWLISKYCSAIQNGYQLIWKYFSQIPIATGNFEIREKIEADVDAVLNTKKQSPLADTIALEAEIDQLVYRLYGLTPEEIEVIENGVK